MFLKSGDSGFCSYGCWTCCASPTGSPGECTSFLSLGTARRPIGPPLGAFQLPHSPSGYPDRLFSGSMSFQSGCTLMLFLDGFLK